MSIGKTNKDRLKEHAGVALAAPLAAPKSDDPLRFWTGHPTVNTLVDLHPFAEGQFDNPHPSGGQAGMWYGPFTGRPRLIAELAPAIRARCVLLSYSRAKSITAALRAWWRLFDSIENTPVSGSGQISKVESLADLNELTEAAAHQRGMIHNYFITFLSIVNDARRLLRLPVLRWVPPGQGDPDRTLIPDDQARELKIALKQGWERTRRTWAQNDVIRAEAERRAKGEAPADLTKEEERLLRHWEHFRKIQQKTGRLLPTGEQLLDCESTQSMSLLGLERKAMRAILFPTVEEADIAFHLALLNSGWNPSTMTSLDATSPTLVTDHPKDDKQIVLSVSESENEEVSIQADKPRARGKTQFCIGLKKHSSSPPVIVAAYLKRVAPLREILRSKYQAEREILARMQAAGDEHAGIEKQYMRVQKLQQGCCSVWLYVDVTGAINCLNWRTWKRYPKGDGSKKLVSYLDRVLDRVNTKRAQEGKEQIASVTPSDFRDIYARWVYRQTGGNILAVMLALGHSSLGSTGRYLDNNIFSAENDEHARRFMTHLFAELERGRVDLTILSQLVRHGPLTPEMEARLAEYRKLMRSRVGVGCADPRHPPDRVVPGHVEGKLCGTQRCLKECPHAKFLPESINGIAMRVEELLAMSESLPVEAWRHGEFEEELEAGEYLLDTLYSPEAVAQARASWREYITQGKHLVPGFGFIKALEATT